MGKTMKKGVALLLVALLATIVLCLASCSLESTVEDFLSSDNYTVEAEDVVLKVSGSTVQYTVVGEKDIYLYYDKNDGKYYYAVDVLNDTENDIKLFIDSEEYISYYTELVSPGTIMASMLNSFVRVCDALEPKEDGSYEMQFDEDETLVISEADGKITLTVTEEEEVDVSYVYAIGDTEVTIPQEILDKVAEEK
jgi:hypothetical protein